MKKNIFILILVFVSCNISKKENNSDSKFYFDLNIYSLQGVSEANSGIFPNIEIRDSNNQRTIIYHMDSINTLRRIYKKEQDAWVCNFSEKGDTTPLYTTRKIYPNALIDYSYTDTINYKPYDIGILRKDTMKYFRPGVEFQKNLTYEDALTIERIKEVFVKFWYEKKDLKVSMYTKFTEPKTSLNTPVVYCYPTNNRSFFWWYETSHYLKEIPCN
jgi:hypothetical protein